MMYYCGRKQFHDNLVDVTSFGASGIVILHKLHQLGLLQHVPIESSVRALSRKIYHKTHNDVFFAAFTFCQKQMRT
jgi:hypothetical protein